MGAGGLLNLDSRMPRFSKPMLPKPFSVRAAVFLAAFPALSGAETTIYRFGGADLPRPPDASRTGVDFRQMRWEDFDALKGGEATRVYMDEQVLSPWVYDPQVNSAPRLWNTRSGFQVLFDGDRNTLWRSVAYECGMSVATRCIDRYGLPGVLTIEFVDRVFVERLRLISGGIPMPMSPVNTARVVRNLGVSSFLLQPPEVETLLHPFQVEVNGNVAPLLDVEIRSDQPVAGLQLALGAHAREREITEIEIYASGVSHLASYVTDIIDFGRPAVWGALGWKFDEAAGSSVFLQTRNGEDANLLKYWRYTGIGDQKVQVTREEYDQLKRSQRAPPSYNYESWNNWTHRFNVTRETGEPPLYPGSRRSFQFRLDFLSLEDSGTRLEYLEFRASDAAVSQVVGELDPVEVRAGPPVRFTYALKARLQDGGRRLRPGGDPGRRGPVQPAAGGPHRHCPRPLRNGGAGRQAPCGGSAENRSDPVGCDHRGGFRRPGVALRGRLQGPPDRQRTAVPTCRSPWLPATSSTRCSATGYGSRPR